jgi:prepilin-type N-terminal cleavage/methylation domain-containing protein
MRASRKYPARDGFTLIELSMVLVVIGLLIGSVLVGQDLIRAAGERAQITQIEKFNSAANTFFEKYGYLPGDIPARPAAQFGFAARGNLPGEGDGNGLVNYFDGETHVVCAGEAPMFWVDLSAAHLIEGTFNTANSTTCFTTTVSGAAFNDWWPQAKIGNGNYVSISPGDGFYGLSTTADYFMISAPTTWPVGGTVAFSPGLTVKQAYDIDRKIDDGLPTTGDMTIALDYNPTLYPYQTIAGSSTTCFDNGNTFLATYTYSIEINGGSGVNCVPYFKLRAGD